MVTRINIYRNGNKYQPPHIEMDPWIIIASLNELTITKIGK